MKEKMGVEELKHAGFYCGVEESDLPCIFYDTETLVEKLDMKEEKIGVILSIPGEEGSNYRIATQINENQIFWDVYSTKNTILPKALDETIEHLQKKNIEPATSYLLVGKEGFRDTYFNW